MKKVIFHIDNIDSWNRLLGNLRNLLVQFKNNNDQYSVHVLANSSGVKGYLDTKIIESIKSFNNEITFVACNNALNGNNIKKDDLNPLIKITAAGVYYLTIMQQDGYSYIKV